MTADKRNMNKGQLLDILDTSTFSKEPKTVDLFDKYVPLIKALLYEVPSEVSFCDAKGNEPVSIREFPGRESDSFTKRPTNAFDLHFQNREYIHGANGVADALRIMFENLLTELKTWKTTWTQDIRERLNQNGDAVRKAIDGETISKWTAIVSAAFLLALSVITILLRLLGEQIDFDEIAFWGTFGGAIIALAVSAIAGLVNRLLTKKFRSIYGISINTAKNLTTPEGEYEKEIKKAREFYRSPKYFKRNIREAKRIYIKLLERDSTDPNCYVGLLAIYSNNFTVFSCKHNAGHYMEAVETWKGDDDYSRLDEHYKADYIEYRESLERYKGQELSKEQEHSEKRRKRRARAVSVLQQIGIYTVLILPIVFSITVLILTFCMPVKSFGDYTGWLYTVIFALDCLSVLAVLAMGMALAVADRNPKFDGFGVGESGIFALMVGVDSGFAFLLALTLSWTWWIILLFVVSSAIYLVCLIWGLIKHKGKCIPRFLLICLVGILFGTAVCAGEMAFPNFAESTHDYYTENSDGTYTYVICDEETESLEIPSEYRGEPVTAVSRDERIRLTHLKSVFIPDSVISIGALFENCSSLQSVIFWGNSKLISFEDYAFRNCSGLTSIEIPNSVTSIGDGAFYNCSGLTSIEIPDSVTSIGRYAFNGCSGLTSIVIPNSATTIGWGVFSGCSRLESITVPYVGYFDTINITGYDGKADTIRPIGNLFGTSSYDGGIATYQEYWGIYISGDKVGKENYNFNNTFYIPASLKHVTVLGGEVCCGAFYGCTNLESVTLGDGVTSIGQNAFLNCGAVHKTKGISYIDKWVVGCDSTVVEADLPSDTVGIADFAFANCKSLTSVTLNKELKIIGSSAFQGTKITTLVIPNSVSIIGVNAFSECTLSDVVFENIEEWYADGIYVPASKLSDPSTASNYLTSIYVKRMWKQG